jgi:cytochrome c oxidase assembly protein subunit 15
VRKSNLQERATILPSNSNGFLDRVIGSGTLKFWAWASLISQILIVVTGGLVRLTASGLGCPTWPKCTDKDLTTVPAQGIHGLIEFSNRMLTFVLLVIAVATLLVIFRKGVDRALGLRWQAVVLFLGIPAQAVLGGFTVWSKLNPWFVGSHFILSGFMIVVATILVWRVYNPTISAVPSLARSLSPAIAVVGAIAVVIGVLVTGAGPHAGDAQSVRNGLDLTLWQHYHSYPAYLLLALAVVQWLSFSRSDRAAGTPKVRSLGTKIAGALVATVCVQAIVGVAQARLGVPAPLVEIHMLLASCLISLIAFTVLAGRSKSAVSGS